MWITGTVVLVLSIGISICDATCSQSFCPEIHDDFLNVHVVPHSHDDVGWLKTVDQYYYGANNSIALAGVQYVYDSTVEELWKDPQKRFVSVEMEFFSRWWREQDDKMKHKVRKIVKKGQLEFVGGGWCMNDEAASSYVDIIDQMTLGLKFLKNTFGDCGLPSAVWQVDPFGHSREQASLFQQMGFEYLFQGRIDHQDKSRRLLSKEMEMIWKPSDSLNISLFTGILYNTYSPPRGFCFDIICGDEPIVDDPDSPMYNIERKAKDLVDYIIEQSKHYLTNNVILTMGEDFQYSSAHVWYKNLDKLMKYVNKQYEDRRIRLFYSTPSCYGKAVRDSNPQLPEKSDDFFPYSSDPHAYWTGYFTSRPAFKGLVRQTSNFLQTCKQHEVAQFNGQGPSAGLFSLERSMAIAQHHDAITGTAKQHVSNDYTLRLDKGIHLCEEIISKSYSRLLSISGQSLAPDQQFCQFLNMSQCHVTEESRSFLVTLYNPLSFPVSYPVRFPVLSSAYIVLNGNQKPVPSQLVPIADSVQNIPGRTSRAKFELVFEADNLPPLGMKSFYVKVLDKRPAEPSMQRSRVHAYTFPRSDDVRVSMDGTVLKFDGQTGHLVEMVGARGKIPLKQQLLYYRGMAGNNTEFEYRASGAYIFRPNGTAEPVNVIERLVTISGPVVTEVYQEFGNGASQVLRLNRGQNVVEIDWTVGPIPVDDGVGREVVSRFTAPDISNEGVFFTDTNGREVLKRQLNRQPTYTVNVTEPIAGNYYPVNAFAYIDDKSADLRMVVLNDRAQGATSLRDGELEFMIHRRLLHDDAFGVGEPLNETAFGSGLVVRGSHWLLMTSKSGAVWRQLAQKKAHPPIVSFVPTQLDLNGWKQMFHTEVSLISKALPDNVNVLTLEPWDEKRVMMRLEHIYGVGEDELYSKPVTVSLQDLFPAFEVLNIEEVNLSANRKAESSGRRIRSDLVTLNPMEIRTLLMTIKKKAMI